MKVTLPRLPDAGESAEAREAAPLVSRLLKKSQARTIKVRPQGSRPEDLIRLPRSAFELLLELLSQMAEGNAVALVPVHAHLTTQEAAELLHISRPHLIHLLTKGRLPYQKVGTHRRVRFADLLRYKQAAEFERRKVLDELTQEAEKLGLGY